MIGNEQPTAEDPVVACPKDGTAMERLNAGGVRVDRCHQCGAIWLDNGEVEQLLKHPLGGKQLAAALDVGAAAGERAKHAIGGLACPRDGQTLRTANDPKQKHIEIDACIGCGGMLLDSGELADLSEFTLAERLRAVFG